MPIAIACLLLLVGAAPVRAQDAALQAACADLGRTVPGVAIQIDPQLGVASHIAVPRGILFPRPAQAPGGKAARSAVHDFLERHTDLFGGGSELLNDGVILRDHTDPVTGLRTQVWQQQSDGIPIHRARLVANQDRAGNLLTIGSRFVPRLEQAPAAKQARTALVAQPPHDAAWALAWAIAAQHPAADITGISRAQATQGPSLTQELAAPAIKGTATAQLTWYAASATKLRLAWKVIFTARADGRMYEYVVDAQDGTVLAERSLTTPDFCRAEDLAAARADAKGVVALPPPHQPAAVLRPPTPSPVAGAISLRVFISDSPRPLTPGLPTAGNTQPAEVARTLVTLASLDATASPNGWIDSNRETRGNNVDAHADANDDDLADLPRPAGSGSTPTYDFSLDLTQAPATYRQAAVVNLFYWCNLAHDRLYTYGFTETAGNFQNDTFGRGGIGNDAVQADAQDGSGLNNANFSTPPDGSPGRMQMYLFTTPNPDLDGDLDATVILHEYAHGLTQRMVNGGESLHGLQANGLGEGWSDFYALALLAEASDDVQGTYAVGSYLTGNYYRGIRRYPYALEAGATVTAGSRNPLTLADITTDVASHDMGEIWCMALWEVRGELIGRLGAVSGNDLMLRLVTAALPLTPEAPTMTQARDAILQAEWAITGGVHESVLWRGFAKRGLGAYAIGGTSGSTATVVASYQVPGDLRITASEGFTTSGGPGGTFAPASTTYTLRNAGSTSLGWTATASRTWVRATPNTGTLAPGATTIVSLAITDVASLLPEGTYTAVATFTNTTSGSGTQTRNVSLFSLVPYVSSTAAYVWVDPTSHTAIALTDDSVSPQQSIGFSFPLYGQSYSGLYVCSNGVLGLMGASGLGLTSASYTNLPDSTVPNGIICPLWSDLNPEAGGNVRMATTGTAPNRRTVVSWVGVPHYLATGSNYTFQAILEESTSDIVFQYQSAATGVAIYGAGRQGVVGIEHQSGLAATRYAYQGTPLLSNNLALRFHRTPSVPLAPAIVVAPFDQSIAERGAATFTMSALTTGTVNYRWQRTGPTDVTYADIPGAVAASYTTPPLGLADSGRRYRIVVTDSVGQSTSGHAVLTVLPLPSTARRAINAGGPALSGYAADTGFIGGTSGSVGSAIATVGIAHAGPAALYQSQRRGALTLVVDGLNAGQAYLMRLHFAETTATTVGQRTFHIEVNGSREYSNVDVFQGAGSANRALVRAVPATADNYGRIIVDLVAAIDQPILSGVQILSLGPAGDTNGDGVVDGVDLDLVRAAFGTTSASPGWTGVGDLDGNGRIDAADLGQVLRRLP